MNRLDRISSIIMFTLGLVNVSIFIFSPKADTATVIGQCVGGFLALYVPWRLYFKST